jgi:hypothetical protein
MIRDNDRVICDKCSLVISYSITDKHREDAFHLCERCNPHPEEITLLVEEVPIVAPKAKRKTRDK